MEKCKHFIGVLASVIFLLDVIGAPAQLKVPFAEVAQTADLIFIGTVEKQSSRFNDRKMIVTDVFFTKIEIVHATERSAQKRGATIQLTYAGGQVGDAGVSVCEMPNFVNGHRYLIFTLDDGKAYLNPLVGADQGLFEVVEDVAAKVEIVLTAGKKAVLSVNPIDITRSQKPVASIQGGNIIFAAPQQDVPDFFYMQPPVSSDSASSASSSFDLRRNVDEGSPMRLQEFVSFIKNVAINLPLEKRILKREGQGHFLKNNGGIMELEELKLAKPRTRLPDYEELNELQELRQQHPVPLAEAIATPMLSGQASSSSSTFGGPLGVCGYQRLPFAMQQVPTSWWSYSINGVCMAVWNLFMDIYRPIPADGTFGNNSQNEFCGWVDDATLSAAYDEQWGTAFAICMSFYKTSSPCGEITQSDIMWNPAYSWTSDEYLALDNPDLILLRPVAMHELGHSWGYQMGDEKKGWGYPETYRYDVPTVMQGYYRRSGIVENGRGIHAADAYYFRRNYAAQTGIVGIVDVGVESYYASNGLEKSTTNPIRLNPGESITLENVTVENMSYNAVFGLRIRFFLSTDITITTADYQMGGSWSWTTFPGEEFHVGNYTTTIPSYIPAGIYYVGAIVTVNGFGIDDYGLNNATFFYDPITIENPNPVPSTSLLSPSSAQAGSPGFTLTVYGSNFVPGSVVRWNGSSRPTMYFNSTLLQATIYSSDIAASGSASVTVYNPSPGGGTSNSQVFSIDPLNEPSNLTATVFSSSQINLSWADKSDSESGFKIERKTGAGGFYAEIATMGANVSSYANTGLIAGTPYCYRVRAYDHVDNSAFSNEACATTLDGTETFVDDFEDGDANGWQPETPARWRIDHGEYCMVAANPAGDELSYIEGRTWSNFVMELTAKSTTSTNKTFSISFTGYNLVFGDGIDVTLFGPSVRIASNPYRLSDNLHHRIRVERQAPNIKVYFDGWLLIDVNNVSSTSGQIGFGSYASMACFDDVQITSEDAPDKVTIFFDNFENGINGWAFASPWTQTTTSSYSPTHSWTDSPNGNYGDGVNLSIKSPAINLSSHTAATLTFWHRYDLERGYDYGQVWATTDDGATWTWLDRFTGTQSAWVQSAVNLNAFVGRPSVKLAFQLVSDEIISGDGWYIDDVKVTSGSTETSLLRSSVATETSNLPKSFSLSENFPNPFNPSTTIRYSIPSKTQADIRLLEPGDKGNESCQCETDQIRVTLRIYDLLGQVVNVLVDEDKKPGNYEVQWDGMHENGHRVGSGVYIYTLVAGDFRATKKMAMLK